MFQSLMVLLSFKKSQEGVALAAHDHLDDLESFFWVYAYLMLAYEPPAGQSDGEPNPVRKKPVHQRDTDSDSDDAAVDPADLATTKWNSEDPEVASSAKYEFLTRRMGSLLSKSLSRSWGLPCVNLLKRLRAYFTKIADQKEHLAYDDEDDDEDDSPITLEQLRGQADKHYEDLLDFFQTAIDEIDALPRPTGPPEPLRKKGSSPFQYDR